MLIVCKRFENDWTNMQITLLDGSVVRFDLTIPSSGNLLFNTNKIVNVMYY